LKALRVHPAWRPQICRDSVLLYTNYGYIPSPYSIYQDIYKLKPGCILIKKNGMAPVIEYYWELKEIAKNGINNRRNLTDKEVIDEAENLLSETVDNQTISDVPIGAFLSGGVDSSTVAALMQKNSLKKIRTFSIGNTIKNYDEAIFAKKIATHLGTDHTEFYVNPSDVIKLIPDLPSIYDEPFSDSSQLPTILLSKLTREHVTVALSGDGGDEVFLGYNRYIYADKYLNKLSLLPIFMRKIIKNIIVNFSPKHWDRIVAFILRNDNLLQAGDKLHKFASIIDVGEDQVYQRLVNLWENINDIVENGSNLNISKDFQDDIPISINILTEKMRYFDTVMYLPDDVLTKVDRASMFNSLEVRVPILDHKIVEYSWKLPLTTNIRNGTSKWVLRNILYQYVPKELIDRPKAGFAAPIDTWLRGPLRDWAESLLDEKKIKDQGYFNESLIMKKWNEHLSGKYNWQYQLWNVLMFQAWHECWMEE
jgi:asparagine synthase (glutamine-hydrolysing)